MQRNQVLKFVLDIEAIIEEVDQVKELYPNFSSFNDDFLAKRAVERHLEIIGEAINRLHEIVVSNVKEIINLRSLTIHSYDTVDSAILWGIIQKDNPKLKIEINSFKNN